MNDLVIDNFFRSALGLNHFAKHLNTLQSQAHQAFPPYNIAVDNPENPSKYMIELAVAGFSREQLNIRTRKEQGLSLLVIDGTKPESTIPDTHYTYRGLAARSFNRQFTLSEDVRVHSVALKDGILTVNLEVVKSKDSEKIFQIE